MLQGEMTDESGPPFPILVDPALVNNQERVSTAGDDAADSQDSSTPVQRPRITVGSAPHLKPYIPQKKLSPSKTAGNLVRHEPRLEATAEESAQDLEQTSTNSVVENTPHHPAPSSIIEPDEVLIAPPEPVFEGFHGAMVEAGPMTVLDYYMGAGPEAVILLLHPDAARAVEEFIEASGAGVLHMWPVDNERRLVAYSRHADHWGMIASVCRFSILQRLRRRIWALIGTPASMWQRWRGRRNVE
ncbi:hypothetical protein NMY22_g9124 [Coprinellus aureogranulatus]|nr:hypothetical protein NMY22_g9124 [Coprinellus aureogranulatus]